MFRHITEIIIDKNKLQEPTEDFCIIENEVDVIKNLYKINNKKFYISDESISIWLQELLLNWKDIKYIFSLPLEEKIPDLINLFKESKDEFINWFTDLSAESKDKLIMNKDYSLLFQFLDFKYNDSFWIKWNMDAISWLQKENNNEIPENIIKSLFSMLNIKFPVSQSEKNGYLHCILGLGEYSKLAFYYEEEFYPNDLWERLNKNWKELFRKEWLFRLRNNNIYPFMASSNRHPLFNNLCEIAYDYYLKFPEKLTLEIKEIIKKGLDVDKARNIESLLPPQYPENINGNNINDLIKWAKQYVKYYNWDYLINDSKQKTDLMIKAINFADLLINEYKNLVVKPIDIEETPLNICSYNYIQELRKQAPVLYVIVDGLNWIDHKLLENNLVKNNFYLKNDTRALFSILPTLTQYSKKALVTGEYPSNAENVTNIKDAFKKYNNDNSFYSHSSNPNDMGVFDKKILECHNDNGLYSLYCLDITELDDIYHKCSGNKELQQNTKTSVLANIVDLVKQTLKKFVKPEEVIVVITSDHGQIFDKVEKFDIPHKDDSLTKGARAVKGNFLNIDEQNLRLLSKISYRLPEDYTIINAPYYFNVYKAKEDKNSASGLHGGCFPEEVLVGLSTLGYNLKQAERYNLSIDSIWGKGIIGIKISNNNTISSTVRNIKIYTINGNRKEILKEEMVRYTIKQMNCDNIEINIDSWPNSTDNNNSIEVKIDIESNFEDNNECLVTTKSGTIFVKTMQSEGGPSLDDFEF